MTAWALFVCATLVVQVTSSCVSVCDSNEFCDGDQCCTAGSYSDYNQSCTSGDCCGSTSYCLNGVCQPPLDDGAQCTSSRQCYTGFCCDPTDPNLVHFCVDVDKSACQAPQDVGAKCPTSTYDVNEEIVYYDGFCTHWCDDDTAKCAAAIQLGEVCTRSAQCATSNNTLTGVVWCDGTIDPMRCQRVSTSISDNLFSESQNTGGPIDNSMATGGAAGIAALLSLLVLLAAMCRRKWHGAVKDGKGSVATFLAGIGLVLTSIATFLPEFVHTAPSSGSETLLLRRGLFWSCVTDQSVTVCRKWVWDGCSSADLRASCDKLRTVQAFACASVGLAALAIFLQAQVIYRGRRWQRSALCSTLLLSITTCITFVVYHSIDNLPSQQYGASFYMFIVVFVFALLSSFFFAATDLSSRYQMADEENERRKETLRAEVQLIPTASSNTPTTRQRLANQGMANNGLDEI
jgi:hypothetical protein